MTRLLSLLPTLKASDWLSPLILVAAGLWLALAHAIL